MEDHLPSQQLEEKRHWSGRADPYHRRQAFTAIQWINHEI